MARQDTDTARQESRGTQTLIGQAARLKQPEGVANVAATIDIETLSLTQDE
jgi:hypothetical protein